MVRDADRVVRVRFRRQLGHYRAGSPNCTIAGHTRRAERSEFPCCADAARGWDRDCPRHGSRNHRPGNQGMGNLACSIGLIGGGVLVGTIGLLDDIRGIRPLWRGLIHLAAAIWTIVWVGGLYRIDIGPGSMELGVVGNIVAILGVTWSINAYNFMDGIDGLAGTEAVTAGVAGAVLLGGQHLSVGLPVIVLAGSAAGFLVWNWAPARIFMGDVGSGFLGFMFAALAIASERQAGLSILAWSILGMVFLVDSTATLFRRALRGERVWEAHRSHAYQRLARAKGSHAWVVVTVIGLNAGFAVLIWPPRNTGLSLLEGWLVAAMVTGGWYWYAERNLAM